MCSTVFRLLKFLQIMNEGFFLYIPWVLKFSKLLDKSFSRMWEHHFYLFDLIYGKMSIFSYTYWSFVCLSWSVSYSSLIVWKTIFFDISQILISWLNNKMTIVKIYKNTKGVFFWRRVHSRHNEIQMNIIKSLVKSQADYIKIISIEVLALYDSHLYFCV